MQCDACVDERVVADDASTPTIYMPTHHMYHTYNDNFIPAYHTLHITEGAPIGRTISSHIPCTLVEPTTVIVYSSSNIYIHSYPDWKNEKCLFFVGRYDRID